MAIKDLIRWNDKGRDVGFQCATEVHPFLALHREMNRMFDDVFRGFDLAPFGLGSRTLDDCTLRMGTSGSGHPEVRAAQGSARPALTGFSADAGANTAARGVKEGSCVTSIAGPNGYVQLYER